MEIGKINFGQLLIDGKAKETVRLVNQEHIPFSFSFDKNSIRGDESYSDSLSVQPISGTVPANGKFNVDVMFRPRKEIEYNYNLVCNVKRKQRPIVLNVKGVGYTIRHSVFYENSHNELLPSEPNQVNFG